MVKRLLLSFVFVSANVVFVAVAVVCCWEKRSTQFMAVLIISWVKQKSPEVLCYNACQ